MKQLATLSAEGVFGDKLDELLPKIIKIAFPHHVCIDINIYIGGKMPHWIKKLANVMESSSKKGSKQDMVFQGTKIN